MPVNFLTEEQNQAYARYPVTLTTEQLDKYFYLDDKDKTLIATCRRDYNKVGYALQLTTVRFLGTFLADPLNVPADVKNYVVKTAGYHHSPRLNLLPGAKSDPVCTLQ